MRPLLIFYLPAVLFSLTPRSSHAQIVVNSLDDNGAGGDCELREAIINANNDDQSGSTDCAAGSGVDTIDLTGVSGTIVLHDGQLQITSHMDIIGPGANTLVINGDAQSRIFQIGGGALVSIKHLAMTNGSDDSGGAILNYGILTLQHVLITENHAPYGAGILNSNAGGVPYTVANGTLHIALSEISYNSGPLEVLSNGGGINNNSGGVLTILASSIHHNNSGVGGGIYNLSKATIVNSTISGNTATSSGGGIYAQTSASYPDSLAIRHSTIANNEAFQGGGLFIAVTSDPDTADVYLYSSIVASNIRTHTSGGIDIHGPVTGPNGYNILGDDTGSSGLTHGVKGDQVGTSAGPIDPMLLLLDYNGGTTQSHLPIAASPALDNGSCGLTGVPDDQRLFSRPLDHLGVEYPNADDGCDVGAVEVYEVELVGGVKFAGQVLLEGAYSGGGLMSLVLNPSLPSSQPYADAVYDGTDLDYDGAESVENVQANVVDWLLLSLRTDVGPESELAGSERPAFLTNDGHIVGLDGDTLEFPVPPGSFYLVVRHRNHLSVMTSSPVGGFASGLGEWDFTSSMGQAYTIGGNPMKAVSGGLFAMFAADGNADGQTTAPDFNLWNAATTAGATGYEPADYNLDGQVTAPDFNLWNANTTAGASSKVPD